MAAGDRLLLIGFFGFTVAMVALFQPAAAATEYTVGDDMGWTVPPNQSYYNDWAAGKTFMGGDSLTFVWNGTQNVAIVSKDDYDNCTKVISVFSGGEAFSYTLPSDASGMQYFICIIDSHCEAGQKLAINVTSSSTATDDNNSGSASLSLTFGALSTVLYTSVAFLLFN